MSIDRGSADAEGRLGERLLARKVVWLPAA
jgi:hypothetical protein